MMNGAQLMKTKADQQSSNAKSMPEEKTTAGNSRGLERHLPYNFFGLQQSGMLLCWKSVFYVCHVLLLCNV